MGRLRWVAAKLKADSARAAEQTEKRRAARNARKVARKQEQANGLDDLPLEVAVAIELNPAQPAQPQLAPVQADDVSSLVERLTAIRERIWRLQAMFAVTLSHDCALEANRFLILFQDLAEQLKAKDATAYDSIVAGHTALLLSPPVPVKQSIPIDTQRLCELRWQVSQAQSQRPPKRPTVPDGLDWMVG